MKNTQTTYTSGIPTYPGYYKAQRAGDTTSPIFDIALVREGDKLLLAETYLRDRTIPPGYTWSGPLTKDGREIYTPQSMQLPPNTTLVPLLKGHDGGRVYEYYSFRGLCVSPSLQDGEQLHAWVNKMIAADEAVRPKAISQPSGENFGVCVSNSRSKECGVESKERGWSNAEECWLTATASEVVLDAETGELIPRELDGFVIHQRAKDGYVNVTAMCKAAGKKVNDYVRLSSTQQFIEELQSVAGIPATLLVVTKQHGHAAEQGTWAHPDVAVNLAQWCSAKFAVAVSRWVRDWMTTGKTPTIPALDISDPHSMMVWLNQATSIALQKTAENQKLNAALTLTQYNLGVAAQDLTKAKEDLDVKELQLSHAVTEKDEQTRKVDAVGRAVALEKESKILSGWLKEVSRITGVGPNRGLKILQAYGILCRKKVEGCSNTDEPGISTPYLDKEWLCYKLQPAVGKTITENKIGDDGEVVVGADGRPVKVVVEVLDAAGDQVQVHSRTVKITPKGCEHIMKLLSTCDETLLWRLISLVKVPELRALSGRYTFSEYHNFAHKMFPKSTDTVRRMIRFVKPEHPFTVWVAWVYAESTGPAKLVGRGHTLEQAYRELAKAVSLY